ncbi:MAG: HPr kinase/phosphorylase [Thermicanus sp.]|nr:HPr kinase/phosphorylase [Thermicanus sp.]
MSDIKIQTRDLVERFQFQVLAGVKGLNREITVSDIHRPGLEIAGYFAYHPPERVQILGKTELSFAADLPPEVRKFRFDKLCNPETPCIVVAHGEEAPAELIYEADKDEVPLLRSDVPTTKLISNLTNYLEAELAPRTTLHGVLVEVYGVGILLTGSSGIGKSETALELLKRGHRLVADDAVEIRQTAEHELIGEAPELIQNLMEIRGLGILNIMTLFGAGSVRPRKKITLVIHLEYWDSRKGYDRLGLDEEKMKILDTELPMVTIPVRPGRNLAVIVEVAAMNYRLKKMGYDAAQQFSQRLDGTIGVDTDDM